jgi:hypothetical protein
MSRINFHSDEEKLDSALDTVAKANVENKILDKNKASEQYINSKKNDLNAQVATELINA